MLKFTLFNKRWIKQMSFWPLFNRGEACCERSCGQLCNNALVQSVAPNALEITCLNRCWRSWLVGKMRSHHFKLILIYATLIFSFSSTIWFYVEVFLKKFHSYIWLYNIKYLVLNGEFFSKLCDYYFYCSLWQNLPYLVLWPIKIVTLNRFYISELKTKNYFWCICIYC